MKQSRNCFCDINYKTICSASWCIGKFVCKFFILQRNFTVFNFHLFRRKHHMNLVKHPYWRKHSIQTDLLFLFRKLKLPYIKQQLQGKRFWHNIGPLSIFGTDLQSTVAKGYQLCIMENHSLEDWPLHRTLALPKSTSSQLQEKRTTSQNKIPTTKKKNINPTLFITPSLSASLFATSLSGRKYWCADTAFAFRSEFMSTEVRQVNYKSRQSLLSNSQSAFLSCPSEKAAAGQYPQIQSLPKCSSSINNPKRVTELWPDHLLGEEITSLFGWKQSAAGYQRGCAPSSEVPRTQLAEPLSSLVWHHKCPALRSLDQRPPEIPSDLDYPMGDHFCYFIWMDFFFNSK